MPWVSTRDEMESMESIVPHDPLFDQDSSWGDTFAAGVGQVFDEELSISASFNNEGYARRDDIAKQMRDDGFDFSPYTDDTGFIDYDRLSSETDFGIQSDLELYEQRNQTLERRRNYANDVFDRGSGFAQFAGSMTGYMLDPVNVATLPIGASASALRGLSTMARVSRVMATEAAIGATAEAIIQPLVYAHKNEIGSPYELDDALMAIGTAALGGAALGGAASGVAGFYRSVRGIELPDTPEVSGAREILDRQIADIEANPDRMAGSTVLGKAARNYFKMSNDDLSQQIILMRRAMDEVDGPPTPEDSMHLEAAEAVFESRKKRWGSKVEAERQSAVDEEVDVLRVEEETRLSRGERKRINKEIRELETKRNAIEDPKPEKTKGVSARKAKANAKKEGDALRSEVNADIDELKSRLETSRVGEEARANLSRVQQGIFPKRLQEALNRIEHRRMVEVDIDYLRKLESTRQAQSSVVSTSDVYAIRRDGEVIDVGTGSTVADIDAMSAEDLARYEAMGTDGVVMADGEMINARGFIDERTAEIDGLESVRVCAYG